MGGRGGSSNARYEEGVRQVARELNPNATEAQIQEFVDRNNARNERIDARRQEQSRQNAEAVAQDNREYNRISAINSDAVAAARIERMGVPIRSEMYKNQFAMADANDAGDHAEYSRLGNQYSVLSARLDNNKQTVARLRERNEGLRL